ncbi:VOC family protein [Hoyosella sp. YIM 151337]|uniref:VOC family protein n=1 Tax=Hoyosella sp. YIM 151337 TaxID=2992742 RepID=UPI002235E263|nr:VOC family protein [Hoyosella sp. YIM 151337]MCW4352464.1 VOC family protein [Hoyosella sp. YIM 151337]
MTSNLLPKLLVSDADAAIDFYRETLNAALTLRVADDHSVHHAELALGSAAFALAQAVPEWGWHAPHSVGGSPVLLTASVPDPDATAERMVQLGAEVLIPVENRPYGKRQGRVRDPFGHLWVISGAPR